MLKKEKQLKWFVIILLISLGFGLLLLYSSLDLSILWFIGLMIGFILQRANFCFAGGFLNFFLFRKTKLIRAIIILIGISTIGFAIYQYLTFNSWNQVLGQVLPWGLYTIVGGFIFGLGMSLAGGCACSSLMRVGEGTIIFVIVIFGFIIGNSIAIVHLEWWIDKFTVATIFIPKYLGWVRAVLLQVIALSLLYNFFSWFEKRGN
ncbi:MAG: hypothetical protein AWU54_490 [Candidatus Frackibacter sp. T328-2]|nr:MAG: hypothetical protein AWU54_490 [Candidatus Frackibacter sp. T328-2]